MKMLNKFPAGSAAPANCIPTRPPAMFSQCKALVRKNLTEQRRHWRAHLLLLASPIFFCILMTGFQYLVDNTVISSEMFHVRPSDNEQPGASFVVDAEQRRDFVCDVFIHRVACSQNAAMSIVKYDETYSKDPRSAYPGTTTEVSRMIT